MAAHGLQLLSKLDILFKGMNRADGIADGSLRMAAGLDALINGSCHVLRVIQRIEDTDDVNAVLYGLAYECTYGVIRVVTVAEDVLSSQQHLQLRILYLGTDKAKTVPRIFIEIPQAGIECRSSPYFHGIVAGLIHGFENIFKIRSGHACGDL